MSPALDAIWIIPGVLIAGSILASYALGREVGADRERRRSTQEERHDR